MKSTVVKRSIILAGHKTSVSLEDAFWRGLKDIATNRRMTMSDLVSSIDLDRQQGNLSSALRLFSCAKSLSGASSVTGRARRVDGSKADAFDAALIERVELAPAFAPRGYSWRCRQCYDLSYATRQAGIRYRLILKAQKCGSACGVNSAL